MHLRVTHITRFTYSDPVIEEVLECRLGPLWDEVQRWKRFELRVKPSGHVRTNLDAFGNPSHLVSLVAPHDLIEITGDGEVETLLSDPFAPADSQPLPLSPLDRFDALHPSKLVPMDRRLVEVADPHRPSGEEDAFDSAQAIMGVVHGLLSYTSAATTFSSTASDALDQSAGVCQDFAHVFIGACRAIALPARYVSGYVLAGATPGQPVSTASHAWAEVYTTTHGWRGFDPTNNLVVNECYVKMAVGRDYSDVPPTRGTFRGNATSQIAVDVTVKELG